MYMLVIYYNKPKPVLSKVFFSKVKFYIYWNNREIMATNSLKHPEKLYNSERINVREFN